MKEAPHVTGISLAGDGPPPLQRFVVHIGVTGHRPNKLTEINEIMLRERVREVLRIIKNFSSSAFLNFKEFDKKNAAVFQEPPLFRIISSLAEGSDRLVAELSLEEGYEMQCPLPFPDEEYKQDFASAESKKEFSALLSDASAIFEIHGTRKNEQEAYLEAGRMMLCHCDLLVSIWNGETANKIGGTPHIIEEAKSLGIPVIWINTKSPHNISIFPAGQEAPVTQWREYICSALEALLLPPWIRKIESKPHLESIDPAYGGTEKSAEKYKCLYRSSFSANFILGGLSVFFALAAYGFDLSEGLQSIFISSELFLILFILLTSAYTRKRRWHDRWIDYHLLARRIGCHRLLAPLGLIAPMYRVVSHRPFDDNPDNWTNWYFRMMTRNFGLLNVNADAVYLEFYKKTLGREIKSQVNYYSEHAERSKKTADNLYFIGYTLFILTLLGCLVHSFVDLDAPDRLLTMLCAIFPALGISFIGILCQGEYDLHAKRSQGIKNRLEAIKHNLDQAGATEYKILKRYAQEVTWEIISEALVRRLLVQAPPL